MGLATVQNNPCDGTSQDFEKNSKNLAISRNPFNVIHSSSTANPLSLRRSEGSSSEQSSETALSADVSGIHSIISINTFYLTSSPLPGSRAPDKEQDPADCDRARHRLYLPGGAHRDPAAEDRAGQGSALPVHHHQEGDQAGGYG